MSQGIMDEFSIKENRFEKTKEGVADLKTKSNLIEATVEVNKINEIQSRFQMIFAQVPERIRIIEEDIGKWQIYMNKFDEMVVWIESKKSIMNLPKPKERDDIDNQKDLLEVCSPLSLRSSI